MEDLQISCDPDRLDRPLIHRFLAEQAYWSLGIPYATLARALDASLCFGAYLGGAQVGFARVVTDRATFAYLCDVFVLPAHRGAGHGKALIGAVMAHPDLQGLRRFGLVTGDAHGLYAPHGFSALAHPERHMERAYLDLYRSGS